MKQALKQLATLGLQGDINAALKYQFRFRIRHLAKEGQILTVYDIGAHHGKWARGMKRLLPSADFYLFEANHKCRPHLTESGFPFVLIGLSQTKGTKIFYSANNSGDSFYPENSELSGANSGEKLELATMDLDSCAKENGFPAPDWIKLDVQGSELDVLAGGRHTFSQTKYLLCEIPLLSYNLNAPKFSDYLDAFAEAGFQPADLVEIHRLRKGSKYESTICQLDLFFERTK